MYPEIYSPVKHRLSERWGRYQLEDVFMCRQCNALVYTQPVHSGVKNRNHCPYCLWSRHVDWQVAGDRLSACKAGMEPIGLTLKQSRDKYGNRCSGELMLIHLCRECGKLSINRIAADDLADRLMEIFHASDEMDMLTRNKLEECGIWLLQEPDHKLVSRRLYGINLQ
jgi:RNHCP domain